MKQTIRIGCGAGYSGDRIDPALALARYGDLDYLVFECLAERTIALAHKRKLEDPKKGYDPLLEERMREVLIPCYKNNTKIITNMGAANVLDAAEKVKEIAQDVDLGHIKVGMVFGDDILEYLDAKDFSPLIDFDLSPPDKHNIISANVYLGTSPIVESLRSGADIVITGRTCDSSLFLAPMILELDWEEEDWERIGKGIAISHLLECGGQVTGGYFADPGYKDVKDPANLGFPIAEVKKNGEGFITKLPDTGGEVSLRTVKEQLLYEIHDPRSYITVDGVADFTKIRLEEVEKDTVKVTGGGGRPRPEKLKVSIGYKNGFTGEAQISYVGEGADKRAKLASMVLLERFKHLKLDLKKVRFDFMGAGSSSNEVRLRVAALAGNSEQVEILCREVESLYTNGPAGGGGVTRYIEENIAITSALIPRENVVCETKILGD
jgi:hypothetical protein